MATVIVPVRNGADALPGLLDALQGQVVENPFEVVVVDNASTDGSAAVATSHRVVSRVVREARPGSYAARNAGAAQAAGEVLVFTDADCRPDSGWLRALLAATAGGTAMAAGPIVLGPGGAGWWRQSWAGYDRALYLDQYESVHVHGFAATANLAVRRDTFEALGGFDAALASGGDFAFTTRAIRLGHALVWAPEAVVHHPPRDCLRETWSLWQRLGRGYEDLAVRGEWPASLRRDSVLRRPVSDVRRRALERNVHTPPYALAAVHALARAAVLSGRVRGRRVAASDDQRP